MTFTEIIAPALEAGMYIGLVIGLFLALTEIGEAIEDWKFSRSQKKDD